MEITTTDSELQIRFLTEELLRLRRIVDEVQHKANASYEAVSRPPTPKAQDVFRAQVTTAIPYPSMPTVTTGSALRVVLIGTTLYRVYPHVTIPGIVSDLETNDIPVNAIIIYHYVDGKPRVLDWNCGASSFSALADAPH
jgi:hypothetical protein